MPKDLEIKEVIISPYARALFLIYNKISGRVYLGMIAYEKNRLALSRFFRLPNKLVLGNYIELSKAANSNVSAFEKWVASLPQRAFTADK